MYLLDDFVGLLDRRLGDEHDVGVVEPDVVGGDGAFAVEGAAEVEHRGHQPPIVAAAEDDDLPQVRADLPAAGERDRLHRAWWDRRARSGRGC